MFFFEADTPMDVEQIVSEEMAIAREISRRAEQEAQDRIRVRLRALLEGKARKTAGPEQELGASSIGPATGRDLLWSVLSSADGPVPKSVWAKALVQAGKSLATADLARRQLVDEELIHGRGGLYALTEKGRSLKLRQQMENGEGGAD